MSGSYERINYSLRPAKSVERKMLCDLFRRLSEVRLVESYRYLGFGSAYFTDFQLFHRALNISSMKSIERDVQNKDRFLFNRPYGCVEIAFGESNAVLPTLDWEDLPTIAWLDYDGPLTPSILSDVKTFCSSASPGSVLLVSVNAHPEKGDPANSAARLQKLAEVFGESKIPNGTTAADLREWGTARTFRSIIDNEVRETLADRNGGRKPSHKLLYRQLVNFHYADGAKMLTVGGIIFDQGLTSRVDSCGFANIEFVRSEAETFLIEPPNLTFREIRHLDTHLPASPDAEIFLAGVPQEDVQRYAKLYRYFPRFTEAEL